MRQKRGKRAKSALLQNAQRTMAEKQCRGKRKAAPWGLLVFMSWLRRHGKSGSRVGICPRNSAVITVSLWFPHLGSAAVKCALKEL